MKLLPFFVASTCGILTALAGPVEEAQALVKAGKPDEAITALEFAVRSSGGGKPELVIALAQTQLSAGRLISAQRTLDAYLRENPKAAQEVAVQLMMAKLRQANGNSAEALSIYRTLAEQRPPLPERAEALAGAIDAAGALGNTAMQERSLSEFVTDFSNDPRTRGWLLSLYRIRVAKGDHAQALVTARQFKQLFPQDPAGAALLEFVSMGATGNAKGAAEVFQLERKLPTFAFTNEVANAAFENLRRSAEGQALIIPLADEFAAKTGDPRFQVSAVEWLADTDQAAEAVKLAGKLLPQLGNSAWGPGLRLAAARAAVRAKNPAEATRWLEEYLTINPADNTGWDVLAQVAMAQQQPDLLTGAITRQQASLAGRKNATLRRSAQAMLRYRLILAAWQRQDFAGALDSAKIFLETDGLSLFGPEVLKLIVSDCSRGLAEAQKAKNQAMEGLKAAKAKKDAAAEAAAKTALEEATKKQDDVNRAAVAKFQAILPSIEKYLQRLMPTGLAMAEASKLFDPFFAAGPFGEEKKAFKEMVQRVKDNPLMQKILLSAAGLNPQNPNVSIVEKLLPELLQAGGDLGYEGGNQLIGFLVAKQQSAKAIEFTRQYLAKYPGATLPLQNAATAVQQLGAPKNKDLPAWVAGIVTGAGESYWPFSLGQIRGSLFTVAEQNRQPAQMEAELKAINEAYPGRSNFEELRRIGVVYAAVGNGEKAREVLLAALKGAQATGDELGVLYSIATVVPGSTEWALPLVDAFLARPNRGPQQAAAQLIKAHLLGNGKKDIAGATEALKAANRVDRAWASFPLSTVWADEQIKLIDAAKITPEQLDFLKTAIAVYGVYQADWSSKLLMSLALSGNSLEFGNTVRGWVVSAGPNDAGFVAGRVIPLAQQLAAAKKPELAAVVMQLASRHFTQVDAATKSLIAQATLSVGAADGSAGLEFDPKAEWAPLMQAAASLRAGDPVTAGTLFDKNEKLFDQYDGKLPPDFLRWASARLLLRDDSASADRAEKILRRWIIANENSTAVPAAEKAEMQLQLAETYFKTQRYDLARSEFQSLANRFPNTRFATEAQFRIGECYLNQKMYPEAAKAFEGLAKSKDKLSASRGEFLLGVLAQERGDTDDAKARFRNVMDLAPSTEVANALLFRLSELYGQENRFSDELILLRSIGLIGSNAKKWHNPGTPLDIVIQDADLGVSRGQSYVPVVVTTTSGDREELRLEAGAAGKGFFRTELPTELGAPKPGDRVLQVNGSDIITYDYPDDFKKQFSAITAPASDIRLAADATFQISATQIVEEQELSFEERLRQERAKMTEPREGDSRREFRSGKQLKPGNNIYLQVKDSDRDISNEPDGVSVRVVASNGSRMTAQLTETGPHTGIFQGTLPTAEVAAHVFASDFASGNEATKAIDQNPATGWEGRNDGMAPKSLTFDLSKPVKLGELKWQTVGGKEKAPKEFTIQTSTDLTNWQTVAATAGAAGAKPDQTARLTVSAEEEVVRGVANLGGTEARYVRFNIQKFSGGAPRIGEVEINDPEGKSLISNAAVASEGDRLQLSPSARITAVYDDDASQVSIGKSRALNQELQATYCDASIEFIAYEYKPQPGQSVPSQIIKQVRRVEPGERVIVRITDYDADSSSGRDKVKFILKSSDGTETPLEATETEPYSGVFTKELDIWSPERPEGVKLEPGAQLQAIYLDEQNTAPGAPTDRIARLEAVVPGDAQVAFLPSSVEINKEGQKVSKYQTPDPTKTGPKPVAFYPPLTVEVIDPAAAKDSLSEVKVTLATTGGSAVEVICPLSTFPSGGSGKSLNTALEKGRFVGQIMLALGDKDSPQTMVQELGDLRQIISQPGTAVAAAESMANVVRVLNLNGQDVITAKYAARDKEFTDQAKLAESAEIAFKDNRYEAPVSELYIGDKVFVSVKDLTADATAENDSLSVTLSTPRGEKFTGTLKETLGHSGEFTGSFPLSPGEKPVADNDQLEVWFGDPVTLTYASANQPENKLQKTVSVVKGTDANMLVFEKKYATEAVAIESQFRMAEAYFELFKNYRELKQTEEANTALKEGMQLLKELSGDYPSKVYEARTNYLLGQFAQELKNYDEAIVYYKGIVQNHGEHPLAADAQYKLGQCYEEKGDMDAASAEYVTLAYTWPEHPLVANVIVRIAEYFYNKKEYPTAAAVSKKFVERFPQHEWAEKMLFRTAQCWFKAEQYAKAGAEFDLLVENYPRGKFRPDAMFWAGESYRSGAQLEEAFRRYKRVTWDYPESDAAKFARGKLVMPEMVKISDKEVTQ